MSQTFGTTWPHRVAGFRFVQHIETKLLRIWRRAAFTCRNAKHCVETNSLNRCSSPFALSWVLVHDNVLYRQKTLVCPRVLTSSFSDFALGSVCTQNWEAVRRAALYVPPKTATQVCQCFCEPHRPGTRTIEDNRTQYATDALFLTSRRPPRRSEN